MAEEVKSTHGGKREGSGRPTTSKTKFAQWVDESEMTKEEIAKELQIKMSTLYGYLNGSASPSLKRALKISELTNGAIPPDAWGEEQTKTTS